MTRETKIGLLVGLAFIIVIGILLSDHLTTTTEPPQARLTQAAETLRQGISTPVTAVRDTTTPPPPVVMVEQITPPQPVPTQQDLDPAPARGLIAIEPGMPVQPQPQPALETQQNPPREVRANPSSPFYQYPDATVPENLRNFVRTHSNDVVVVDPRVPVIPPQPEVRVERTPQPAPQRPAAGQFAEYQARPGDTLNKLAGRFLGGNTEANRQAIIAANPSLADNPDKIIAGRIYMIPVSASSTNTDQLTAASSSESRSNGSNGSDQNPGEHWYTVRENDSLWKIAAEQLGDGTAWTAIKELNKDALGDSEVLRPGMRLRLPSRPVASIN